MAEPIVPKSPPKESKKTELDLDFAICCNEFEHLLPEITEPIRTTEEMLPLIKEATAYNLPGSADYFVGILIQTLFNLSRLHDELIKLQEMLVKGGE